MQVLTPRTGDEAIELKARYPDAVPIQGGTDVMVALNFDRMRPTTLLNLNDVEDWQGWSPYNEDWQAWSPVDDGLLLGNGVTYSHVLEGPLAALLPALAEASRTVGSPQIRNRGTIVGNLGTASPAGDALPPLLIEDALVAVFSVRGFRNVPLEDFLIGVKETALAPDELIAAVYVQPSGQPQTFMKIGPRNAMVIAVASLALVADMEKGELRAAFGSCGPVARLVRAPLEDASTFPEQVAAAASPIDDVRGTAAYRRHALRVLTQRALERCLA
jgi:CO/xanthine dehydrogenase FAD-binding subunit